jgi:1,4-dihydroxy-2-naphthoate octaprenyltransferase
VPEGSVTIEAVIAGLPMAALITNILVVNNVRDMESDRRAGKRTLAVLIGYTWSRVEFCGFLALAYAVPVWFALRPGFGLPALLPLFSAPLGVSVARTVLTERSEAALNPALERTGQLVAVHALLFGVGLGV